MSVEQSFAKIAATLRLILTKESHNISALTYEYANLSLGRDRYCQANMNWDVVDAVSRR